MPHFFRPPSYIPKPRRRFLPSRTADVVQRPDPLIIEFVIPTPTGTQVPIVPIVFEFVVPETKARLFQPTFAGLTGVIIHQPDLTVPTGLAGTLTPLAYKVSRYQNKIGNWSVTVPVDEQVISGSPLQTQIKANWRVSIVQESNNPEGLLAERYLLYQGIVEDHEFRITEAGTAVLVLSGSMRTLTLQRRTLGKGQQYNNWNVADVAKSVVDGTTYLGSPGGIVYPDTAGQKYVTMTLNVEGQAITRYGALLKLGELGRYALRESWDYDKPELTPIDNPPDSGLTLVNLEAFDPALDEAAEVGFGVIGAPPKVRYEGAGLVNRIIPIGSDTISDGAGGETTRDLTLQWTDKTTPYTVQSKAEPDGSTSYYIQDADSIAEYTDTIEVEMVRTDIKNPSDNASTRRLAANVLYAVAVNQLIKSRSEKMFVGVPLANGPHIWALPGDMVRLDYQGVVEAASGSLTWLDSDNKRFIVAERHDVGDESGVRKVDFVLAAPVMEFPVPGLPSAIILPPLGSGGLGDGFAFDFGSLGDGWGSRPLPLPAARECCDDPSTSVNAVETPEQIPSGGGGPATYRQRIHVVNGAAREGSFYGKVQTYVCTAGPITFTLRIGWDNPGKQTGWTNELTYSTVPAGWKVSLVGTSSGRGYNHWYIVDSPVGTLAEAQAMAFAVSQGSFSLQNTNAAETPYNGRKLGNPHIYTGSDPGAYIDAVTELGQSFIFPTPP